MSSRRNSCRGGEQMRILEYSSVARRSLWSYGILLCSFTLFASAIYVCLFLLPTTGMLQVGALVSLAVLAYLLLILLDNVTPIIKAHEYGSYVDLDARSFVYWEGPRPAQLRKIDLDKISEIRIFECIVDDGFHRYAVMIDFEG